MDPPIRKDVFQLPVMPTPSTKHQQSPTQRVVKTGQPLRQLGDNSLSVTHSWSKKPSESRRESQSDKDKLKTVCNGEKATTERCCSPSPSGIFNSKLEAPLIECGLLVDSSVCEETKPDELLCTTTKNNTTVNEYCKTNAVPHCPHCGKCTYPKCTDEEVTTRSGRPVEDEYCYCNPTVSCCVETVTCLSCVQGCFYHCSNYEDNPIWTDKPCSCHGPDCCLRWSVLGLVSVFLPCLFCYPVLHGSVLAYRSIGPCMKSECNCNDGSLS